MKKIATSQDKIWIEFLNSLGVEDTDNIKSFLLSVEVNSTPYLLINKRIKLDENNSLDEIVKKYNLTIEEEKD